MFVFEARAPHVWYIRKGRNNEEDKHLEFRPEGLAFFWPLITLFARYISLDMLLANIMIINPKSSPANVIVISLQLLRPHHEINFTFGDEALHPMHTSTIS